MAVRMAVRLSLVKMEPVIGLALRHRMRWVNMRKVTRWCWRMTRRMHRRMHWMGTVSYTHLYGKDPEDRNIRIAPSYPPLQDLIIATELFALCVKLVSVNKLLEEM